ncbi:MAG: hypothetical protein IPJ98_28665 [Bryobacterales bacterium]|nr:hypothetical protein [Bryobacterales bacterium]
MLDGILDAEAPLPQFNKLMTEWLKGTLNRNTFRPWEIEILLDIEGCNLRDANRREILRRYQKAVKRNVDRGGSSLLKLSEYLELQRRRSEQRQTVGTGLAADDE